MKKMGISKYEAAAFYDYKKFASEGDATYIVIDLDDSSAGICECKGNDSVSLKNSFSNGNKNLLETCIEYISNVLEDDYRYDVRSEFEKQLADANNRIKDYLIFDRLMDAEMMKFSDRVIMCSEFEKMMNPIKEIIVRLSESINKQMSGNSINDARFIVIGTAQNIYFVEYCLLECFSASPALPDPRFRNTLYKESVSNIVKLGRELYDNNRKIERSYYLTVFDRTLMAEKNICMIQKGQNIDQARELEYIGPVFVNADDGISVKVDSERKKLSIPYSLAGEKNDLVELAIGIQNGEAVLFIRRVIMPKKVHRVKII